MYITVSGCNVVAVIDGQSKLVMRYIPVGTYPGDNSMHDVAVSSDGNYAYLSFYAGTLLQKIELINELESKLTDVYINSKTKRQTTLEDYFKQN